LIYTIVQVRTRSENRFPHPFFGVWCFQRNFEKNKGALACLQRHAYITLLNFNHAQLLPRLVQITN